MHSADETPLLFDVGQRSADKGNASWGTWVFRQVLFLTVKFAFLFAFYTLQFQSHQIESPPANPALQEHLAQFRKDSRTSKHEYILERLATSRQLAERNGDEDDLHQEYHWQALETQCTQSDMFDPFPDSFDAVFYQAQHDQDREHYETMGRNDGWNCTRGQHMREIVESEIVALLPGPVLEVGPFINPLIRNTDSTRKVQYFDIADWSTMETRAKELGYIASPNAIEIDFVDPTGDLSSIDSQLNKYSMVVSSNVVGVQLNLAKHFQQVGNLLEEGGYYTMLVPDKRFSHDHFAKETTIADVLQDYFSQTTRTKHKLRSFIEHTALQVESDAEKNWHGEYGFPFEDASDAAFLNKLQTAIADFQEAKASTEYVDVLQYQFTPHSLAFLVDTLYSLGLIDLRVHRLYDTLAESDEFSIVLKKCTPV